MRDLQLTQKEVIKCYDHRSCVINVNSFQASYGFPNTVKLQATPFGFCTCSKNSFNNIMIPCNDTFACHIRRRNAKRRFEQNARLLCSITVIADAYNQFHTAVLPLDAMQLIKMSFAGVGNVLFVNAHPDQLP